MSTLRMNRRGVSHQLVSRHLVNLLVVLKRPSLGYVIQRFTIEQILPRCGALVQKNGTCPELTVCYSVDRGLNHENVVDKAEGHRTNRSLLDAGKHQFRHCHHQHAEVTSK